MNLLIWMVGGMIVGCTVQVAGRERSEVAIAGGLFAGVLGAVIGGALATDLSAAMRLFGQSISGVGLLAALLGAAAVSAALRLLWKQRSPPVDEVPRARFGDGHSSTDAARPERPVQPQPARVPAPGDTEPAAFGDWHARPEPSRPGRLGEGSSVSHPASAKPVHDL